MLGALGVDTAHRAALIWCPVDSLQPAQGRCVRPEGAGDLLATMAGDDEARLSTECSQRHDNILRALLPVDEAKAAADEAGAPTMAEPASSALRESSMTSATFNDYRHHAVASDPDSRRVSW